MSELRAPKGATKKKKIVGRGTGSGRGGTSGKGNKGQNARSGGGVRPGFEGGQMPLYRRIARRGFSNYPFKQTAVALNLSELERVFADGEVVTLESLKEHRLIKKSVELVKILGNGELSRKLTVNGVPTSESARKKIEQAGGTVSAATNGQE